MAASVGVDVGGTFTDVVVRAPSGRLASGTVPTTPTSPADGVMHGLALSPAETCGGGGFGPPAERPAEAREHDRREGYA